MIANRFISQSYQGAVWWYIYFYEIPLCRATHPWYRERTPQTSENYFIILSHYLSPISLVIFLWNFSEIGDFMKFHYVVQCIPGVWKELVNVGEHKICCQDITFSVFYKNPLRSTIISSIHVEIFRNDSSKNISMAMFCQLMKAGTSDMA